MVEKKVSVKMGQLWVGGERAQGPGWTWAGQTPLSWFCARAHVCLGSLPGHMKDFLEEIRLSTFQSKSAEPTGQGRSSGQAVWWVMDSKPLPGLSALAAAVLVPRLIQPGVGMEQELLAAGAAPPPAPSWPQNVEYCFAPSTHSSCGCRFTFR